MSHKVQELLSEAQIREIFNWIIPALRVTAALDDVKMLADGRGCLLRSHDAYGRLPEIKVEFGKDRDQIFDKISLSMAQLCAVVRFRQELASSQSACRFIHPVYKRKSTLVGIYAKGRTIMAEGIDLCHAYQELTRIAANASMQVA